MHVVKIQVYSIKNPKCRTEYTSQPCIKR